MIKTGFEELDNLIDGYKEELNLIYGPPGSGKTTLCKLACITLLRQNKKIIYLDTENGFSIDRFNQIAGNDAQKILGNLIIIRARSLSDQFEKLESIKNLKKINLVVIDSIGKFYREKVKENPKEINNQFVSHLNSLRELTRNNIPVIITNQVYEDINNNKTVPLGGKIILNFCKKIIELKDKPRRIILKKPKEKEMIFEIVEKGIRKI